MDALKIIDKYYPIDNELKRTLLTHSKQVCKRALEIAVKHSELALNKDILKNGSLLHDIGIFLTYAPGIHCFGKGHYLLHGFYGGQILRNEGYPNLARICERHTGAGLTKETIIAYNLPLPHEDLLPETNEEKVICYADKFYSKSNLSIEKTSEQAYKSLLKFGEEGTERFLIWDKTFK